MVEALGAPSTAQLTGHARHPLGHRVDRQLAFVRGEDGVLLTPPAHLGLLPGVFRQTLLDEGKAREAELHIEDLENGFFLGNALRLMMDAKLKT